MNYFPQLPGSLSCSQFKVLHCSVAWLTCISLKYVQQLLLQDLVSDFFPSVTIYCIIPKYCIFTCLYLHYLSSAVAVQPLVALGLLQESISFFPIACPTFAVSYAQLFEVLLYLVFEGVAYIAVIKVNTEEPLCGDYAINFYEPTDTCTSNLTYPKLIQLHIQ